MRGMHDAVNMAQIRPNIDIFQCTFSIFAVRLARTQVAKASYRIMYACLHLGMLSVHCYKWTGVMSVWMLHAQKA